MSEGDCDLRMPGGDIWRTMSKIRAAVYRVGFNLWDMFRPLDPNRTSLVSEAKFLSVLLGPLKQIIGLTEQEINELASYFSVSDGRIFYTQFCEVIHNDTLEREGGPELNFNPLDVNKLSPEDERRLYQLLGKIALQVTAKSILLKPFYQDYLLQGKKGGLVTRGMLDQVLKFLDINLSAEDFHILVKRYMHDALTVRYMAFMKEIDGVIKYYDDHQMVDLAGKLLPSFKDIELDEAVKSYLRPEIVEAPRAPEVGLQKIFRQDWRGKTPPEELIMIIKKIQAHVQKEKIRAEAFFRVYDTKDCGRIPVAAFLRGLSELRETWRRERTVLYLSKLELKSLCDLYRDPGDLERILWQQFCRDVEEVFEPKDLEDWPRQREEEMRADAAEQARLANERRIAEEIQSRMTLGDVLKEIRTKTEQREICLKPTAARLDRKKNGHLTEDDMREVFIEHCIFPTERQYRILWNAYKDETGFVYKKFFEDLKNVDYKSPEVIAAAKMKAEKEQQQIEQERQLLDEQETNIVEILGKIKRKMICYRVKMMDFLKPYDKLNHQVVSRADFLRGLDSCKFDLSQTQLDTIMDVFSSPEDPDKIEYRRFCSTVDEESQAPCLQRTPLKEAMEEAMTSKPLPVHGFVNFEERVIISTACEKLCRRITLGSIDVFKSFDKEGSGTVGRHDFLTILQMLNTHTLLTPKEVDTLVKGFGVNHKGSIRLDYLPFLNSLDIVFRTKKAAQV